MPDVYDFEAFFDVVYQDVVSADLELSTSSCRFLLSLSPSSLSALFTYHSSFANYLNDMKAKQDIRSETKRYVLEIMYVLIKSDLSESTRGDEVDDDGEKRKRESTLRSYFSSFIVKCLLDEAPLVISAALACISLLYEPEYVTSEAQTLLYTEREREREREKEKERESKAGPLFSERMKVERWLRDNIGLISSPLLSSHLISSDTALTESTTAYSFSSNPSATNSCYCCFHR